MVFSSPRQTNARHCFYCTSRSIEGYSIVQHLVDSLDLRNLRLEFASCFIPQTLLCYLAALTFHERWVPVSNPLVANPDRRSLRLGDLDLRGCLKILHDLSMRVRRSRNTVGNSSGANLWISCTEVHDQSRYQLGLVWVGEWCPRRTRISAVDCHFAEAFAFRCGGGDSSGKLTSEVEQSAL